MADSDTNSKQSELAKQKPLSGVVLFEVADEQNRNLLFAPTQERLRGRWSMSGMPPGSSSEVGMAAMPEIPGMFIAVDFGRMEAVITDPLSLEENKSLLEKINVVHKEVFRQVGKPVETRKVKFRTKDDLATWVYHLHQAYRGGHIKLRSGEFPDADAISKIGDIRLGLLDPASNSTSGRQILDPALVV